MKQSKMTVWYNTKCPVCNRGITRANQRLARAVSSGRIEFLDINLEADALREFGADIADVRRRLHAVDDQGRLYVGADCAIEIWRCTPGQRWLGQFAGLPVIRQIAGFVYDRFADGLYAWNRRKERW